MSNTHLTQCPHCKATFKVQDQHLNAAGGKVRCGSCLEVFNALENLIDASVKTSTPSPVTETHPAAQAAPSQPRPTEQPEDSEESELVFEDNPDEDSQDDSYTGEGAFSSELSDSFLELGEDSSDHFTNNEFVDSSDDELMGNKADSDESWAEDMLEDINTEQPTKSNEKQEDSFQLSDAFIELDEDASTSSTSTTTSATASKTEQDNKLNKEEASDIDAANNNEPDNANETIQADSSHQYKNLQADPLDLPNSSSRSFLGSLVWTVLNLSLLIVLAVQFAWYNYGTLAQYEELRPIYQKTCELLKCKLPDLVDTTQIRSQNLIVRSHPTARKALIIDAVIVNQAPYEQPFPNLALYFSDLNNKIVAQRLFEPSEYLAGEVKGWTGMPKGTPIHISLEILDPGNDAVNYTVGFFKHTPEIN